MKTLNQSNQWNSTWNQHSENTCRNITCWRIKKYWIMILLCRWCMHLSGMISLDQLTLTWSNIIHTLQKVTKTKYGTSTFNIQSKIPSVFSSFTLLATVFSPKEADSCRRDTLEHLLLWVLVVLQLIYSTTLCWDLSTMLIYKS